MLAVVLALAGCAGGGHRPSGHDGVARHVVQKGDTVYAISRRYGVSVRSVIAANGLNAPYTIRVGQRLRIPAPAVHVVAKGDTVYGISRRYGVEMAQLTRVNGIGPPYTIHVGQRIAIPGRGGAGTQVASAGGGSASKPSTPPPPAAAGRFHWPLTGRVVSTFGGKSGGLRNDGINIAAARGAKVRAAENGTVAYAGDGIKGFGNLLLIKHSGGYMTAYGHNDVLLVERGRTVRRGEVIARVGSTGNVGSPQLHFEIRKGKRAVDPMPYLGAPQTALASPVVSD
jgi:murein DD-endopeptidase MepM/ murein hydrolase activator NlpD